MFQLSQSLGQTGNRQTHLMTKKLYLESVSGDGLNLEFEAIKERHPATGGILGRHVWCSTRNAADLENLRFDLVFPAWRTPRKWSEYLTIVGIYYAQGCSRDENE
jgi:hypothetical protein